MGESSLDQAAPAAALEFDGSYRKIVYSLYSITQLKRLTGKNPFKGELDLADPEMVVYMIWAGLLHSMPELDGDVIDGKPDQKIRDAFKRIGSWLTLDKISEVSAVIGKGLAQSGGQVKKEAGEKK